MFYNGGDVGCGIEISIFARDQVINPIIYNAGTGQRFALKFEMKASDEIKIITFKGEKSVTLIRESVRTNIINYMEKDSIWFQLSNADNVFTYDAEQGKNNMLVSFSYNYSFVGV